jgi:polyhydroxybutyrate depolymerase
VKPERKKVGAVYRHCIVLFIIIHPILVLFVLSGTVAKEHKFQIDPTRIYVTGMSNGGFMTNRVACEMSDIVAAAAPVAGPLMNVGVEDHPFGWGSDGFECKPGRPVPILHMHSSKDLAVPFGGSALNVADFKEDLKVPGIFIFPLDPLIGLPTLGFPSVDASIDNWRKINNVTPASKDVTPRKASKDITCTLYSQPLLKSLPSATVELCVTDTNEPGGLGHCWPGEGRGQCGKKGVDNPYIWDFFKKHTHPNPKLDHDEL